MGSITETPPFELRVLLELRDVVDDDQVPGDREDCCDTRFRTHRVVGIERLGV